VEAGLTTRLYDPRRPCHPWRRPARWGGWDQIERVAIHQHDIRQLAALERTEVFTLLDERRR